MMEELAEQDLDLRNLADVLKSPLESPINSFEVRLIDGPSFVLELLDELDEISLPNLKAVGELDDCSFENPKRLATPTPLQKVRVVEQMPDGSIIVALEVVEVGIDEVPYSSEFADFSRYEGHYDSLSAQLISSSGCGQRHFRGNLLKIS